MTPGREVEPTSGAELEPSSGAGAPTAVAGAPATLVELYAAHRLSLTRLALLLVDDVETAQDVVQDAFAGLHARSRRLPEPGQALSYRRVSVVNASRSTLRRRRTARAYVPPHEPA